MVMMFLTNVLQSPGQVGRLGHQQFLFCLCQNVISLLFVFISMIFTLNPSKGSDCIQYPCHHHRHDIMCCDYQYDPVIQYDHVMPSCHDQPASVSGFASQHHESGEGNAMHLLMLEALLVQVMHVSACLVSLVPGNVRGSASLI